MPSFGDGIGGLILSIVLWVLMAIGIIVLLIVLEAVFWFSIFVILAMLYWVFFRALKLVFNASAKTKGNLGISLLYALSYTILCLGWVCVITYFASAENNLQLSKNASLTAKYVILDEVHSSTFQNCSNNIVPFKALKPKDCLFSVGEYEFDILKQYEIDANAGLKTYWKYLSEGPVTYTITDLNADTLFKKHEGLEYFSVRISKDRTAIVDSKDRLEIERTFNSEKLILIKNKTYNEKRLLYAF